MRDFDPRTRRHRLAAGFGTARLPPFDQTHHQNGGKNGDGDDEIATHGQAPLRGAAIRVPVICGDIATRAARSTMIAADRPHI